MNKNYFPDLFFTDLKTFLNAPSSHQNNVLTSHDFDPKDPLNRLKMVNIERREDFCIFLSLLILIDQILYTYDKENYDAFSTKYNIPKLECCGHGRVTTYPFSIFNYIKISPDIFNKNTEIFFVEFVNKILSDGQREAVLKALEYDEDLEKDECGRVVKYLGKKLTCQTLS
jgi:hypothetical protein